MSGGTTALDERIDYYPTHEYAGFRFRRGRPIPFGATLVPNGVNFSVFTRNGRSATLVLFEKHAREPLVEIPFPDEFRIGDVYCMTVFDLDVENVEYGYRVDGPWDPVAGMRFDRSKILCDPYAKAIGGRDVWRQEPDWSDPFPYRSRLVFEDFDWEEDRPLETPIADLVLYEMHVRGFTSHPSSGAKYPGTYAAIREKIPYLKELGINAIELMPIFEFDEWEGSRRHPVTGEALLNFWGYSTLGFFAPKAGFAATGRYGMQVDELKTLIKELHRNGIEVILDVVFNHTAEGDHRGPTISFRGLDNRTYYMINAEGYYLNFSGCGNTLNCNQPVVRGVVLDCLRYWASEFHVDGFRFDLAAILGRDPWGRPLPNPPLLETLAHDPLLARCKLIAEAWDAGGLYQVGSFPAYGRWGEWNGRYRDTVRRFLRSEPGLAGDLAQRIQGSPDLYWNRGPAASVNFVTCHDGFTLRDLVSYDAKHNEANGEDNRDGSDDNNSWNCGWEGDCEDPGILALRERQAKNALTILLLSQGLPMILMGDEVARTQWGNNNAYCHDTEIGWLDWGLRARNGGLFRYTQQLIRFRKAHPVLRRREFLTSQVESGYPEISFHGTRAWSWQPGSGDLAFAFMLCERGEGDGSVPRDAIYVALNSYWEGLHFEPPALPPGMAWRVAANTGLASPEDVSEPGKEPVLGDQASLFLGPRSVVVLVGR